MARRSSPRSHNDDPIIQQVRHAALDMAGRLGPRGEGWMLAMEDGLRGLATNRQYWPATLDLPGMRLHLGCREPGAAEATGMVENTNHRIATFRPHDMARHIEACHDAVIEKMMEEVSRIVEDRRQAATFVASSLLTAACLAYFPGRWWIVSGHDHGWWHARIERLNSTSGAALFD